MKIMATTNEDLTFLLKQIECSHNHSICFETPKSLSLIYEELNNSLSNIINLGGELGESAQKIHDLISIHLKNEKDYSTRPLGLLKHITSAKMNKDLKKGLSLVKAIKGDLPKIISEHQLIIQELENLRNIAKKNDNKFVQDFVGKFIQHIYTEEELLYPIEILIGKFLLVKFF